MARFITYLLHKCTRVRIRAACVLRGYSAPAQKELVGTIPTMKRIRSLDQVPMDLPVAVHRSLHDETLSWKDRRIQRHRWAEYDEPAANT